MTEDEIIAFASALPDVAVETASAESGAPEAAWGDSFVYVDPPGAEPEPPERRWPFATLVVHDYAGFDESSRLDREGVFRVNVNVGRSRFEELVGYSPSQHAERRRDHDYTELDVLAPPPGVRPAGVGMRRLARRPDRGPRAGSPRGRPRPRRSAPAPAGVTAGRS